ncbi:hypothetical protein [Streptomyces sp. NPDC048637]|uniref:hypothetical protein n=1 Tax=Streptomyces sp. NPDC048637 TaxID=3155636 RepID=UPI0034192EB9
MSDSGDSGNSDDSSDSGYSMPSSGSGRSGRSLDSNVLQRAMRWETFALVAFLVILAVVAS